MQSLFLRLVVIGVLIALPAVVSGAVTITWTVIDYPTAGNHKGQGTTLVGVNSTSIVGGYCDAAGRMHGVIYDIGSRTWTVLDNPNRGV